MSRTTIIGWVMLALTVGSFAQDTYAQDTDNEQDYQYALIEAVKQKNLGNLAEAIKLYRLVIREKEDCAVAYYELGTIFLMMNQLGPAVQNLEKAYEMDSSNRWYTLGYLGALGAEESYKRMKEVLKRKISVEEDAVEWRFQLANVYAAEGHGGRALRLLNKIEKERGFSEKVTLLKASVYEEKEKFGEARKEVEKVMDIFPEAVQFRIVAAELSMKEGEEEQAAEYYKEILEIDSSNIFAVTNLTDYYRKKNEIARSLEYLALSFYSQQIEVDRKLAIMSYYLSENELMDQYQEELTAVVTAFRETHPEHKEGMIIAANFFLRTGMLGEAFQELKMYLDQGEGNYSAYMQAVMLANASGNLEGLLEISKRGTELYPDSIDLRFFRAIGHYERQEYREVIDVFQGHNLDNFSRIEYETQAQILLAESYYRLDQFSSSDSLFEKLIREQPDNYVVLNNFSYYLAERGTRLEDARKWSEKAVRNNRDNATFLDTYAWVLYKLEEYELAERIILEALEKGGDNDPEINEHAGDIQRALNSHEIARSYYENALILGGERKRLEKKIDEIK